VDFQSVDNGGTMTDIYDFIREILEERDQFKYGSIEWHNCNKNKAFVLEDFKPSWTEKTAYYLESDLKNIKEGFTPISCLPNIPIYEDKRSILEYNGGNTRQIIPYCLVKCDDEYYLVIRENNGDARLNGKMALLGGHVDQYIVLGMFRELDEEAGITPDRMKSMNLVGIIKTNGDPNQEYDVSKDHVGLVYLIEIKSKKVRMQESGVQKAIFVRPSEFHKYLDRFENWLDIIVRNLFHS
jgi:predicted NUDIX family phosphoesterase